MNTYAKYCPNVFVAKCDEQHEKGEIITVQTKYGKENECEVHNLVATINGFYYYSITRVDGYNAQERAKMKSTRYSEWANRSEAKSYQCFERSKKDHGFLSLGEPIKIGHHSERGHRRMIEQANANMDKSVEYEEKARQHARKAEYWKSRESDINLSMPESLEYYAIKLEEAKEYHEGLKSGKYPRLSAYTLTYAKKSVNEIQKNLDTAIKLWA